MMRNLVSNREIRPEYGMKQDIVTDLDIQALVDNESQLAPEDRDRIYQAITDNPILRQRYTQLMRQKKLLQSWWEENKKDSLQ